MRLSPFSSTTNDAAVPSVTTGVPVMLTFGSPSLSLIVPVAVVASVASAALPGALRVTVNVSPSASSNPSTVVATLIVCAVTPELNSSSVNATAV